MSVFPPGDEQDTIERYTRRYQEHGYSPQTLGWNKGRQQLRFRALTELFDLAGQHVLDLGCGFGDLNQLLQRRYGADYHYTGVDLVPALLSEARSRWPDPRLRFVAGELLSLPLAAEYHVAIASGVFNHRLLQANNYEVVAATLEKVWPLVSGGVAFDFLSNRVDYELEHAFHFDPVRIVELGYRFTRRIVLRNDYLPFEFALILFKDGEVDPATARFRRESGERVIHVRDEGE